MNDPPSRPAPRRPRPVERLPGGAFDRVYKKGKRSAHRGLVLIVSDREDSNIAAPVAGGAPIRLGVVVGRTVARDAVPRNRLKRLLRESFRIHAGRIPAHSVDCILLARPPAAGLKDRHEVDGVLEKMLKNV